MRSPRRSFSGPTDFLYASQVATIFTRLTSASVGYPTFAIDVAVPDKNQEAVFNFREPVAITAIHLNSFFWSDVGGERLAVHVGLRPDESTVRLNGNNRLLLSHYNFRQAGVDATIPQSGLASGISLGPDSAIRALTNQKVSFFWSFSNHNAFWSIDAIAQIYYVPLAYGQIQSGP